jgi:hypothetical protein
VLSRAAAPRNITGTRWVGQVAPDRRALHDRGYVLSRVRVPDLNGKET